MIKNETGLTVAVLDQNGEIIGKTYPKRAKGLVKKCRAQFVSDSEIRLIHTDPTCKNTEDLKMDNIQNTVNTTETEAITKKNYIFFNPKKWQKHPDVQSTVSDRFYINSVFGEGLTEVYSLGNWQSNWSEITSEMLMLEKNTEYHFLFWLNGGENDRSCEVCQCQIMFSDNNIRVSESDWNSKLTYKLNRSFLKPLKRYMGWELYDIPFITEEKEYTQIRFVAQFAPMTVMAADEPKSYNDLPEFVDEFSDKRPQRHNIVFEDGWPANTWYSTAALKNNAEKLSNNGATNSIEKVIENITDNFDFDSFAEAIAERVISELNG